MSLSFTNPEFINKVYFELNYDTELLNIKDISIDKNLPSGWQLTNPEIDVQNGQVKVALEGTDTITGNNFNLANFAVNIPNNATYGASQIIELESVKLNDRNIDINHNNGIQIIAKPGDVFQDGNVDGLDVYHITRLAAGLDSLNIDGFVAVESNLVADINQDGFVSAFDAYLALKV